MGDRLPHLVATTIVAVAVVAAALLLWPSRPVEPGKSARQGAAAERRRARGRRIVDPATDPRNAGAPLEGGVSLPEGGEGSRIGSPPPIAVRRGAGEAELGRDEDMQAGQLASGETSRLSNAPLPPPRPAAIVIDDPALENLPGGVRFAASLNASSAAIDGTAPVEESNVLYDIGDGAYFPANARLGFANRGGVDVEAGTIAFWIEPVDWTGSEGTMQSFFHLHDLRTTGYRLHILKESKNLRVEFVSVDEAVNLYAPIDDWARGEWHHVAITWSDGDLRLYVNGVLLDEASYSGELDVSANARAWWGSDWRPSGQQGAGAALRGAVVADRAFTAEEIAGLAQRVEG